MKGVHNQKYSKSVAINVVIANMIGTGVFTSLGYQTGSIPSWFSIMVLWCLGALISLFGALVYSEIATRIKKSGGEYTYLSEIYYPWLGFIAGWISFIVGFAAPIAAVAIAIGSYTTDIFNISYDIIASIVIIFIGSIHLFGIKTGGWFQNIATRFKILLIFILIFLPIFPLIFGDFSRSEVIFNPLDNGVSDFDLIFSSDFAISLVWVCFAYSGWNASVYFADKIENPSKNIPYSLIIGTLFVSILYLILNSAFLFSVNFDELTGKTDIANVYLKSFFSENIAESFSLIFGFALFSSLSSLFIAGPSVLETMGKDYEALKLFNKKNKYNSPYFSILSFIIFPIFLIQTASFEEIIQYIGVCLSFFSVLVVMGLFFLRKKDIEKDVFKLPFGNMISALFVIINLWMIYHLISNDLRILLYVLFTIILGWCFYLLINFIKKNK
jgi:APA family basic amino acid/polyamine antiporter